MTILKVGIFVVHGITHTPKEQNSEFFENLNFCEFFCDFWQMYIKLVNFKQIFLKFDAKRASLDSSQHNFR